MPPESSDERRKYSRVDFDAEATLEQGGSAFPSKLIDISLNGLLVKTPDTYEIRTDLPCTAHIPLSDNTVIHMQVVLVHTGSDFLGFQCSSIDMDSIIHLRRIIELNLDDPAASERALAELLQHDDD